MLDRVEILKALREEIERSNFLFCFEFFTIIVRNVRMHFTKCENLLFTYIEILYMHKYFLLVTKLYSIITPYLEL